MLHRSLVPRWYKTFQCDHVGRLKMKMPTSQRLSIIYALDTNIQVRNFTHSQLSLICISWLIHSGPMTHLCVIYALDTNIQVGGFTHPQTFSHLCVMTRSFVCRDSFIMCPWLMNASATPSILISRCVTWLVYDSLIMSHDSVIRVSGLIYNGRMTYLHMRHDSFICVTWIIRICDVSISCVWHALCIMYGTASSYVSHDSFIWGASLMCTSDMTHLHVWHYWFICLTWLIHRHLT